VLTLTRLFDHVNYIHLSDNGGQKVEHLPPGKGKIDWNRFFATLDHLGYSGDIGIDVGGAESGVENIDQAYTETASWLSKIWSK